MCARAGACTHSPSFSVQTLLQFGFVGNASNHHSNSVTWACNTKTIAITAKRVDKPSIWWKLWKWSKRNWIKRTRQALFNRTTQSLQFAFRIENSSIGYRSFYCVVCVEWAYFRKHVGLESCELVVCYRSTMSLSGHSPINLFKLWHISIRHREITQWCSLSSYTASDTGRLRTLLLRSENYFKRTWRLHGHRSHRTKF